MNADRGCSERNVLVSASHTHAGPGGFANFDTYNTAAPSAEQIPRPFDLVNGFQMLLAPRPADPQLYTFLVRQVATAIRRADDDLAPAASGWGSSLIVGMTRNRSLEAHLANHGVIREFGEGGEDPDGADHPIDPTVNVLRVDKLVRRRGRRVRVPIGGWSTFSAHGTVTRATFERYNGTTTPPPCACSRTGCAGRAGSPAARRC
jgi:neutral ceramidase